MTFQGINRNFRTMNKTRIVLTALLAALYGLSVHLMGMIYSPMTGAIHAQQLDDTASSYAMASMIRNGDFRTAMFWIFLFLLLMVWWKPIGRLIHKRSYVWPLSASMIMAIMTSCTPVKVPDVIEVKSNETAWAIPMDGSSQDGQIKFNSVGFLNDKKVAAKRIWVDKVPRKTGRFYWDIEWIPAIQVISVDRSLVTRQWTDGKAGTSTDDEGVGVVTKDSVKLRVGLTVTASIDEDDASTYLYYHGARPLAQVLDQNIRSFAVAELTRDYSELSLSEAQTQGDRIYKSLFDAARKTFKPKGVTIQYLGNAEGLTYADSTVQSAINARYLAEQSVKTAEQEQNAQKIRNQTLVMNAQTESDAAQRLLASKEAAMFKNELNIKIMQAQAALKWNGQLPAYLMPANSPMLPMLNVGGAH